MIRPFNIDDTDSMIEVWRGSASIAHDFLSTEYMDKEENNIRHVYIPNTKSWVYEIDQRVVGFISMINNEVGAIFVLPEYQGQGIGKELMDLVSSMYSELEVDVFVKNRFGRSFYHKYGFKLVSKYEHDKTGEQMLKLKYSS